MAHTATQSTGLLIHSAPTSIGVIHPLVEPRLCAGLYAMTGLDGTGTEWLVPKSPVAFHSLGLLPVCIPF